MRMRAWENSIALAGIVIVASALACRRAPPAPAPAAAAPAGPEALLGDVVDPWTWAAPKQPEDGRAWARSRAIEAVGPFERARPGDPASPLVNTNADYWTRLTGIAWDRDVDLDFDREPVDLDGDGKPDATVTRHIHAKGGILANPGLFGLTPTPDDPRGQVGRISVSTGVLGLREPLGPDGKPTGQIGMTCWLCHGEANPVGGAIVLGLPGVAFDYGLLLATAAVLDDGNPAAVEYRRARGFPSGRTVRARLLLAGPGRQDLTGEFGLDVTVPGYHSARYPGTSRVRQRTRGLCNPISVPTILAAPGLSLENWSGSEAADAPWLERSMALAQAPERSALTMLNLVGSRDAADEFGLYKDDREAKRRALLFDLRNLGTLGLQQDSFPGLLWADAIYGHAAISPRALDTIPTLYAAASVRAVLARGFERPRHDGDAAARGLAIFTERTVGTIANRQILKLAPAAYAAAKLEGPILAPIDPTKPLDARLTVRCADCHSGVPLERKLPLASSGPPLGRCTHCHVAHDRLDEWKMIRAASIDPALLPIAALPLGRSPSDEVAFCEGCHSRHRDFGPLVFSSSRLYPFDADGDGDAQLAPDADRRAGGIGTDPWLAFDVPRTQWPFAIDIPTISDPARAGHVGRARIGAAWVRVAPLVGLYASAPYLHNGSVPTLRALLDPPAKRPRTFPLGRAGFVFDTRLPGNGNQGHDFGTALTPSEKDDLVAYLESL
jgi:processive rubber oxygenase RoxA-like protein